MTAAKAAVWLRVSTDHQDSDNQVPDVEQFAAHHGYEIAERYVVSDSAWKNGGGTAYKKTLQRALDDAHAGRFGVLVVWSLDRIVRNGAERESARRSERTRAGLARRRAEGKPVGRQPGVKDKKARKRSGYVAAWEEGGSRRERQRERSEAP